MHEWGMCRVRVGEKGCSCNPGVPASAARMFGSIVIAAADPSSVHRCASASITWQLLIELETNVGKSEGAKRRNSGAGRPGRVTGGLNEGLGMYRIPECAASAAQMFGSIVVAAADPSSVHRCASASIRIRFFLGGGGSAA